MGRNNKSLIKKYLQVWCLGTLIVTIQACTYSPKSEYGVNFNPEREKIGLPILQENWKYVKIHGNIGVTTETKGLKSDSWINPNYDRNKPYYLKKTVTFTENTIVSETDWYIGKQKFNTIDGTFKEALYITYSFINNSEHKTGWKYIFFTATKGTSSNQNSQSLYSMTNINITKEVADSILISWGLGTATADIN